MHKRLSSGGLVDLITDVNSSLDEALKLAERLLVISAAPLRITKQAISVAANALNNAVSYMDLEQYVTCQSTNSHKNALDAFFNKR